MITTDGERFRLTIPRIIGLFVLDALEYSEQWRAAAIARAQLEQKWSECAAFQVANGEAEEN